MATPRQKVQVGIFLTVCGLLLAGTLVVLSGLQRQETIPYVIEFNETVSGLFPGADVRYRGVPVGRVTDIAVTPQNRIRVQVEVRPSVIRLRQGMKAQLSPAGITGQLYINLDGGDPGAEPLAAHATIPATPSLFSNLSAELPLLLASINSILGRFDKALGEEGQVVPILQEVERLVRVLNTTMSGVGTQTLTLLQQVNTLTEGTVQPLLGDLSAIARTARLILERTAPAVQVALASSAKTLQQLERHLATLDFQGLNTQAQDTLQQVSRLAEDLRRSSEEFNRTMEQVRGDTTRMEFHVRQTVRNLRETLLSAKQLFDYLEQDPSALLVGKRAPARTPDEQRR